MPKKCYYLLLVVLALNYLTSCGQSSNDSVEQESTMIDITDKILTNQSNQCTDYVNSYNATVNDVKESKQFTASLIITENGSKCDIKSNAIPNHDFNETGSFFTQTAEQSQTFSIATQAKMATIITQLSLTYDNAVFLNGVKLDLLAAGCFGVANGNIGCHDESQPFRYDPMYSSNRFGTDSHNAHTQPDGTYHYHGNPMALFWQESTPVKSSPVIGFAADGFPIFGSFISDQGNIRKVKSSYKLKFGSRVAVSFNGKNYNPGGSYDGTYVDDFEFQENSGDLDECNGMSTTDGVYGYYVTDSYPWVLKCFKGTPDTSFQKNK